MLIYSRHGSAVLYYNQVNSQLSPLRGGEGDPIPFLGLANQLRVNSPCAATDVEHLGPSHFAIVGEWHSSRNESDIADVQSCQWVVSNLDGEQSLENL